jgi:hypothetical protein
MANEGAVHARQCPNCGAALDSGPVANRITCRFCGHAFDLPAAPAPPQRQVVLNISPNLTREVAAAQRVVSSFIMFAVFMGVLVAVAGSVLASRGCSKRRAVTLDAFSALSAISGMPNLAQALAPADFLWDTVAGPPIPVPSSSPESVIGRIRKRPGDDLWIASFEGSKFTQAWAVGPFGTYSQGYRSTFTAVVGRYVVVTDYRANIHSYDAATGHEVHVLQLSDRVKAMCGAPDGKPQVWIEQNDEKTGLFDATTGLTTAATRPAWCPSDWSGVRNDCRGWLKRGAPVNQCRGPEAAPKVSGFEALNVLQDGDVAVALGKKKPGTAVPLAVGFDPQTHAVRWQHPVASGDLATAAESGTTSLMDALSDGRFVSPYETTPRGWHFTAFDARSGDRLWDIELQKGFGVENPEGFSLTPTRLYVMRTSSVEVYDAKTGSLLGTIGRI